MVMRKTHYHMRRLCKVHTNKRYMHLEFGENVLTLTNPYDKISMFSGQMHVLSLSII